MKIRHNLQAMNADRCLRISMKKKDNMTEKLCSGYRINRAADDAAGLSISEKMRAQARGLDQASRNVQDGVSMIQTAEGAVGEMHAMLQRMRQLAVQAANDTYSENDRNAIQKEINELVGEIDTTAVNAKFNGLHLLDGTSAGLIAGGRKGITIHAGADASQIISISIESARANDLGIDKLSVLTHADAGITMDACSEAIDKVSQMRSKLGAIQNRMEHTIANMNNAAENLQSAESRIRDMDMAKGMMEHAKSQIMIQAGMSMLVQANQSPESLLALLKQEPHGRPC